MKSKMHSYVRLKTSIEFTVKQYDGMEKIIQDGD